MMMMMGDDNGDGDDVGDGVDDVESTLLMVMMVIARALVVRMGMVNDGSVFTGF